jgi:hypothetical protein
MLYGLSGLDLNGSVQIAAFHYDLNRMMMLCADPPAQPVASPSPTPPPQPFVSRIPPWFYPPPLQWVAFVQTFFAAEPAPGLAKAADSPRLVAREPQLLRKFLLLDSGGGLFRNLVRDRGLWLRCFSGSRFLMTFRCYRRVTRWPALSSGSLPRSALLRP